MWNYLFIIYYLITLLSLSSKKIKLSHWFYNIAEYQFVSLKFPVFCLGHYYIKIRSNNYWNFPWDSDKVSEVPMARNKDSWKENSLFRIPKYRNNILMEENQLRLSVLVVEVNDGLSLNRFDILRHERNSLLRALAMVVVPVEKISMWDHSRNPKMHESKY